MTTDTQSKNTQPSDNNKIFAPLGKYAVIAVIMVSIIVTTAIMLDKQLNTIDAELAEIKANIAQPKLENSDTVEITASSETTTEPTATETVAPEGAVKNVEVTQETSTTIDTPTADALIITEKESETVVVAAHQNDSRQTETTTAGISLNISSHADATQASPVSVAKLQQVETRKTRNAARQARIDAFKQEQKQHMAEIFARIKVLESQQLDRYKNSQSSHVSNLREQITRQQQMIEALILRNEDLYQLRATNIQRNQSNREQILNRI